MGGFLGKPGNIAAKAVVDEKRVGNIAVKAVVDEKRGVDEFWSAEAVIAWCDKIEEEDNLLEEKLKAERERLAAEHEAEMERMEAEELEWMRDFDMQQKRKEEEEERQSQLAMNRLKESRQREYNDPLIWEHPLDTDDEYPSNTDDRADEEEEEEESEPSKRRRITRNKRRFWRRPKALAGAVYKGRKFSEY